MYITRKGQYALFFLIDLALHDGSTVTVKQVAKEYDLSEKYMEQVASKLRHAGIVRVIRGSKGGYYLSPVPCILDDVPLKMWSVPLRDSEMPWIWMATEKVKTTAR